MDLFIPSLPDIQHYFTTTPGLTKSLISVYLLSFGLFQLISGPLTDSFGRKKLMLFGMLSFAISTYGITMINSIESFMILRALQGISISICGVASRAIIPDIFSGHQYKKMMNYMTITWSIGPVIAPYLGGYLQHYFGWKSAFYFLSAYASVAFLLILFVYRETLAHKHEFSIKNVVGNYFLIIQSSSFTLRAVSMALLYSVMLSFSIIGVFIVESSWGYSPVTFGKLALLMGVAWMLGNMTNRFTLHLGRTQHNLKLGGAMVISAASALLLATTMDLASDKLFWLGLFMFIPIYFSGMVFPNFFGESVAPFKKVAGSAGALVGASIMIGTSIVSFMLGFFKLTTPFELAMSVLAFAAITLLLMLAIFKIEKPLSSSQTDDATASACLNTQ
ncbi:multidrug effflux MFS transporter [Dongshaea marina]|uniref:multidrug effflux MFS transporter n=1 Tax=Dongshaea marina TaxID=2047966 RepID=UPI001F4844B0|nr:multidrug effflux MFS transporter [Dongshaea marina]